VAQLQMKRPVWAVIEPLFERLPENDVAATTMPAAFGLLIVMVPLLRIPPPNVVALAKMPLNDAAIRPELVMPPLKVWTLRTEMPVNAPPVIVPLLEMPPPNVFMFCSSTPVPFAEMTPALRMPPRTVP